jgi:hypothetical protein
MRARWMIGLSTVVWVCACSGEDPSDGDCAEASVPQNNPTVVTLSFDTDRQSVSYVEFSAAGGETMTTPMDAPSTHHEVALLGLPPSTDVAYKIVIDEEGEETTCEGTVTTGRLPPTFPPLEITIDQPDRYVEPYLLIALIGDPKVLAVIDREGNVLWYLYANEKAPWVAENIPGSNPSQTNDLSIVDSAFWPSEKQLLFNLQLASRDGDVGSIFWTNWQKEDLRAAVAPLSHHTFALHQDTGTVNYIKLDIRDWFDPEEKEKVSVVGDAFVDLDTEGNEQVLLSTWDQFDVEKNLHWDVQFYPEGHDWTHANANNFYPDRNAYLFSFANTNTFMEWSYDTGPGEVFTWSDWHVGEETTPFTYQHDPRWTPDGEISLTTTADAVTRGAVYSLDYQSKTYTEVWSHGDPGKGYPSLFAFALGENHLLPNGNRLINFGSAAVLREVTPEGEVVWEMTASPKDVWIGSVEPFNDFYAYE